MAQDGAITYISPQATKNPGDDLVLNCTVSKPDGISVSWYKDINMVTLGSAAVFPRYQIRVDEATNTYSLSVSITKTDREIFQKFPCRS